MKKLGILALVFLMVGALSFAKVTINEAGGKYTVTITNSSYANLAQLNIIGSFMNWQIPGEKMTKNANGEWEATIPLDVPMIKYKFYDPAKSGDSAYLDDPEFVEKIANPFGTFDYLVKRPKAGKSGEEDFAPVFGMWTQVYYSMQFISDMTGKIVYDKDGKVVYSGFRHGEHDSTGAPTAANLKAEYKVSYDDGTGAALRQVVDDNSAATPGVSNPGWPWTPWMWRGENGTTNNTYTRVIWARDQFHASSTLKLHGKVSKIFKIDVEINAQASYTNRWEKYWYNSTMDAREQSLKDIARSSASNFVSRLFGGLGQDYVFAKQYYHGTTVLGETAGNKYDEGSMHVDQVQFAWTTKDFDIYMAPAGGKNFSSNDPMGLIGFDRTGSTNYVQSAMQAFVHPTAVKGLNINLGTTYSGSTQNMGGQGYRWGRDYVTGSTVANAGSYRYNVPSDIGRYLAYADLYYDILGMGKYTIGATYTMNSYAPGTVRDENFLTWKSGLDAFANAIHGVSVYGKLAPIEGLKVDFQGAMEIPTQYFDAVAYADGNANWNKELASKKGWDFLAHAAEYINVGYGNKMFNVALWQGAAGVRFEGDLAKYGSLFANYQDVFTADMSDPYYMGHGDAIGKIKAGLNFDIKPLSNDLLKISYNHIFSTGAVDAVGSYDYESDSYSKNYTGLIATEQYKADRVALAANTPDPIKTVVLGNIFNPGVSTKFKGGNLDITIGLQAWMSLYSTIGETTFTDAPTTVETVNTNTFNLDEVNLSVKLDNISDVLKTVDLDYRFYMTRNDPEVSNSFGAASTFTKAEFTERANKASWNSIINQIIVEFRFKNDIFVGAGYVFRLYHGLSNANAGLVVDNTATAINELNAVPDYYNMGIALQFKYVVPVKELRTPTIFANLGLGWQPFRMYEPGFLQTADFAHDRPEFGDAQSWNQERGQFQFSDLTIGVKWDL